MTHPCERDLASYIELFGEIGVDLLQMNALCAGVTTYADVIKVLSHSPQCPWNFAGASSVRVSLMRISRSGTQPLQRLRTGKVQTSRIS